MSPDLGFVKRTITGYPADFKLTQYPEFRIGSVN
jgi:hypothetical protein